jgi:hypothetical protein
LYNVLLSSTPFLTSFFPCSLQMEARTFTEAPVGQATKKHAQAESDTAAYAKVGSIVAGAAVITYYGVPLAASAFSSIAG